jgi:CDP-4-dehydro-6-deoxyglucose reductase
MRKARLVEARALSPSVRSLSFHTVDGAPLGHLAGQYVDLVVPTASGLPFRRPYSVASAPEPGREDVFEIAVTRVEGGPTSEALHAMAPGALVELGPPEGTFVRRPEELPHPALFVATGTGLAPLRAMLAEELRAPRTAGPPLVLLFGCRTRADILWEDELRAWTASPRFQLHVTLSRPPAGHAGLSGYVQRHVEGLAAASPGARVYVCGLSAMVDDVVARLGAAGVPPDALRYETYD